MNKKQEHRFVELSEEINAIRYQMMSLPLGDKQKWAELSVREKTLRAETDALLRGEG